MNAASLSVSGETSGRTLRNGVEQPEAMNEPAQMLSSRNPLETRDRWLIQMTRP